MTYQDCILRNVDDVRQDTNSGPAHTYPLAPGISYADHGRALVHRYVIRVVHCQFHFLDHCGHMLNPLISNYQSIRLILTFLYRMRLPNGLSDLVWRRPNLNNNTADLFRAPYPWELHGPRAYITYVNLCDPAQTGLPQVSPQSLTVATSG